MYNLNHHNPKTPSKTVANQLTSDGDAPAALVAITDETRWPAGACLMI
ncbi:hypothetical protein [Sedimentitalea sp.]